MSCLDCQSFLGANAERDLAGLTVGFVGLGGGGSHLIQQAAHIGIGGYVLADPDRIDLTNTNRLIGGTLLDVLRRRFKTAIAARLIRSLNPSARIVELRVSWHDAVENLKRCDVILGAVDSFIEREQLERFARRHLIPYIDIGMDVHDTAHGHLVSGQAILSSPGHPCLRCCGIVTDENLAEEARRYGSAGGRPQVVWPNGVLASTAIGLLMHTATPWHRSPVTFSYLVYDGNRGTITPSPRAAVLVGKPCPHHPGDETGDPLFDIRKHPEAAAKPKPRWQNWLAALMGR